jgi:hypothetical protein
MSEDEFYAAVFSAAIALFMWFTWTSRIVRVKARHDVATSRRMVLFAPVVCGAIFVLLLRFFASFDVQEDVTYTFFYVAMGAAWVGVGARLMPFLGFCPRHDLVELGNHAVTPLVVGGLLAFTLAFTGGNIGDGPGWWVVVFASGIASVALVVAWFLFDGLAALTDCATIERDFAAGLRGGALLLAFGLIFGRGAAGDYHSAEDTVVVFASTTWPALVLLVAAVFLEWVAFKRVRSSMLLTGIVPSMLFVGAAAATLTSMGHW